MATIQLASLLLKFFPSSVPVRLQGLFALLNLAAPKAERLPGQSNYAIMKGLLWCVLVAGNSNFEEINKAFGVPKELSEISIIAEKILIFNEGELSAEPLLSLILSCDLIRKPERFFKAQQASSIVAKSSSLNENQWKKIFKLVTELEIDKTEKNGKIIAKKMHEDRLVALDNYIKSL